MSINKNFYENIWQSFYTEWTDILDFGANLEPFYALFELIRCRPVLRDICYFRIPTISRLISLFVH